ncbi:hypothetical protein ACWEO2_03210 [Nocardia sp. NPDC004278]
MTDLRHPRRRSAVVDDRQQIIKHRRSSAASFPLRRPSPIASQEMATYLLARSEGTIGELTGLAHRCHGRSDRVQRGVEKLGN